jgi:hypothetical protein
VQPHARIIAILREPTSLLRSLHLQLLQTHDETEKSLQRALRMEPDRRAGRRIPRSSWRPQLLLYSDYVRYTEQLRRYQTAFGEKQMLVLIYDDYRHSNEAVVRDVLRFLDVDDSVPVAEVEANETVRLRSRRVDDVVLALSVGHGPVSRYAKAAVKSLTPQRLRRRALELTWRRVVYGTPRPPDERFLVELRQRFKPEVVALSEHLGRDLVTLWGYDKVR